MAQKILVTRICDLTHDEATEASHSHDLVIDGSAYTLETCQEHEDHVQTLLTDLLAGAVPVKSRTASNGKPRASRGSGQAKDYNAADVRAWLAQHRPDIATSPRGRLSREAIDAYRGQMLGAPVAPQSAAPSDAEQAA